MDATSHPYDTIVYNNDNEKVLLPGYRVDALTDAAIRYIDDFPAPEGYREKYLNSWMPPDLQALTGNAPAITA